MDTGRIGKLIAEMDHHDMVPFLKPHLKLNRVWGFAYWLVNILILSLTVWYAVLNWVSFDHFQQGISLGFFVFFCLLPIHEAIHGVAYKLAGAPHVSFGASWKKLIFYALADQYVIGLKKFLAVALAPFLLISILLICLFFFLPSYALLFLGALILHTAGCFGDFALVSFMYQHRALNIVTVDDVKANKTYFLEPNPILDHQVWPRNSG